MREKKKNWASAADAIKSAFKRLGLSKKMGRYEVWNQWEKIAGPAVASHAKPVRWQGSVLVVAVEHPSWMQELVFLKPTILENVRETIPKIDISDIRFEIG